MVWEIRLRQWTMLKGHVKWIRRINSIVSFMHSYLMLEDVIKICVEDIRLAEMISVVV